MKINQVEELVGITKKNIRFYEEQGIIEPKRNPENGYREYSLKDVEQLNKIKLLRRLDVPIEQIRQLQEKKITFDECMSLHINKLTDAQHNMEIIKEICVELSNEVDDLESLDSSIYFSKMDELEKGGISFMDPKKTDVKIRRTGALLAAVFVIGCMLLMIGFFVWANSMDAAPIGILIVVIGIYSVVIIGVLLALRQRLKELKGGEADEASKY